MKSNFPLIVALALFTYFPSTAEAEVTCTSSTVGYNYSCRTSSLGPLAVNWYWGVSGNLGGSFITPAFNPTRVWNCGSQAGTANTRITVIVEWNDGTFSSEWVEIDCYHIFQTNQPITTAGTNYIYNLSWGQLFSYCFSLGWVFSWCEIGF